MGGMRHFISLGIALLALALPLRAEPVVIFAASSLKTVLDEVIEEKDLDAVAVYGGSAALARQIAQGAEADVIILAHKDWMNWLDAEGVLASASRCDVAGNALVLAGANTAPDLDVLSEVDVLNVLKGGRLAVGQLRSVPAGQYTAAYLEGQGWLAALRPHLAEASNVRLALALVARQEAPLGFVYASDVVAEPRVRRVFTPKQSDYPLIRYPSALAKDARDGAEIALQTIANSHAIFSRNGFLQISQDDESRCR